MFYTEGILNRIMPPNKANKFRIETVEVTSSEAGVYTIVMTPYNCGHDFPLLSLAYGQVRLIELLLVAVYHRNVELLLVAVYHRNVELLLVAV